MKEYPMVIRDEQGNIIRRSANLRGIREYCGDHTARRVCINHEENCRGRLSILFFNGARFETEFASYTVLCQTLRNWTKLRSVALTVDDTDCGIVDYHCAYLIHQPDKTQRIAELETQIARFIGEYYTLVNPTEDENKGASEWITENLLPLGCLVDPIGKYMLASEVLGLRKRIAEDTAAENTSAGPLT